MRHLQLSGAAADTRIMRTDAYDQIDQLIRTVNRLSTVGAVFGPSGVGKTFLVEHHAAATGLPVYYVDLPRRPSRKEVLMRLLAVVSGRTPRNAEAYVLHQQLEDLLTDREGLVVIDEVQGLDNIGFDQLTHLHQQPGARWGLILSGAATSEARLLKYEHLRSRCHQVVHVDRLQGQQLVDAVRQLHDWFAHSPADLLLRINAEVCKGNLRTWVRFLDAVGQLHEMVPAKFHMVDARVAAAAAKLLRDGPEALTP